MLQGGPRASTEGRWATAAALAAVVVLGTVLYSRTFAVPWYFDDQYAIVENPQVHDLRLAVERVFERRGLTGLTFAANFALSGLSLASFHATNLAIHLLAAVAAYFVLRRIFEGRRDLALFGSLLFVAHPLQTQAVTYVVQRGASLAALLCLAAVAAYLRFRDRLERGESWRRPVVWVPYAAALIAGALALQAKENAVVLPGLLLLCELGAPGVQPGQRTTYRLVRLLPFGVAPSILAIRLLGAAGTDRPGGGSLAETVGRMTSFEPEALGAAQVAPLAYLAAELETMWRYLWRVALPVRQLFDYGLAVDPDPWRGTVLLAALGILALLLVAWTVRRRLPPVALGIAWFFVALSPESTLVPLDVYFEHRLYLPMVGVSMAVPALVDRVLRRDRRRIAFVGGLLICALALLTVRRNEQWRDPVRLWTADLEHGSRSYRSLVGLADSLHRRGDDQRAAGVYRVFVERAEGQCRSAPCGARYLLNLGVAFERLGELERAIDAYRRAIAIDSRYAKAHYNLGVGLYHSGDKQRALEAFRRAAELAPGDGAALFNWGSVALELGDARPAESLLETLQSISPGHAERLAAELAAARASGSR